MYIYIYICIFTHIDRWVDGCMFFLVCIYTCAYTHISKKGVSTVLVYADMY